MSDRDNRDNKENMFKKLARQHQPQPDSPAPPATPAAPKSPASPAPTASSESAIAKPQRRGRPSVGKQHNPYWRGETYYYYYVRGETELDVAAELLNLKREGLELDKSDLADALLAAWVRWRQGEDIEPLLLEIAPKRPEI